MDELYYEGWDAIERAWREGLTPDPLLTVSEWADKHRVGYLLLLSLEKNTEPLAMTLLKPRLPAIKITAILTFGGGDALVSRSYQTQTGKVRPGKPPSAGLSVLPPNHSI